MTTTQLKFKYRILYFLGIGGFAALIHLFTVYNLVNYLQVQALIANVFAFLIAFNVSFLGHKYFTFSRLNNEKILSLPHFFLVAASAGIINETLYFLLLQFTQLHYLLALFLVLGIVSVYSFIISRYWACR
ncbi:putative GtrA-like protein [Legionella wadsworthii]|uniref:Putative GtrA-like protein n=1 Tax=Legionella wadsworthii TaxID=28088 RepID=A0A378LPC2_9GAMM|nr:GtrA family protein [Legionella wadsworthii]STY28220.1 putative GtrA-like protein [Legionella wadsworthii]